MRFPVRVPLSIAAAHVDNAGQVLADALPRVDSVVSKSGLSRVLTVKNIHYIFQRWRSNCRMSRTTLSFVGSIPWWITSSTLTV